MGAKQTKSNSVARSVPHNTGRLKLISCTSWQQKSKSSWNI